MQTVWLTRGWLRVISYGLNQTELKWDLYQQGEKFAHMIDICGNFHTSTWIVPSWSTNGSFTYTDMGTGSDPSPGAFSLEWSMATVILHRKFTLDQNKDRYLSLIGYCIHFWDRPPSPGEVSVYVNEPLYFSIRFVPPLVLFKFSKTAMSENKVQVDKNLYRNIILFCMKFKP